MGGGAALCLARGPGRGAPQQAALHVLVEGMMQGACGVGDLQALFFRGMDAGRSDGKPEEAAGGGSMWQERMTWHYEGHGEVPSDPMPSDSGALPLETHDMESFVSNVLEGASS